MSATNSSNAGGYSIGLSTARFLDASMLDEGTVPPVVNAPTPPVLPAATPPAATSATQDNDSSVADYMSRLMQRVNGGSSQPSNQQQAPIVVETKPASAEAEKPLSSEEYVPKKQAPERRTDMSSLRKLANDSTRVAITSFAERQHQNQVRLNRVVSIGAAVASIPLFLLSGRFGPGLILGGVLSLAASAFFGFRLYKNRTKKQAESKE